MRLWQRKGTETETVQCGLTLSLSVFLLSFFVFSLSLCLLSVFLFYSSLSLYLRTLCEDLVKLLRPARQALKQIHARQLSLGRQRPRRLGWELDHSSSEIQGTCLPVVHLEGAMSQPKSHWSVAPKKVLQTIFTIFCTGYTWICWM